MKSFRLKDFSPTKQVGGGEATHENILGGRVQEERVPRTEAGIPRRGEAGLCSGADPEQRAGLGEGLGSISKETAEVNGDSGPREDARLREVPTFSARGALLLLRPHFFRLGPGDASGPDGWQLASLLSSSTSGPTFCANPGWLEN